MEDFFLYCIESRVDNNGNIYGRFQLGSFFPGEAVTIANSLRRSLLSEIHGLAITAVEIEGVTHEYSTVAGIRESVLDILLNVKQIVLRSDFIIKEPQVAFLQVQGPGVVRTGDIKFPISIQSVDPEQYIATLLYDGFLKMKFMICSGKNYLVQTPLGLKDPCSVSYGRQLEIYPTKSSRAIKQNLDSNLSSQESSKSPSDSDVSSDLRIPTEQNSDVSSDLTSLNSQSHLKNSKTFSTDLLKKNKKDSSFNSVSKKNSTIDPKVVPGGDANIQFAKNGPKQRGKDGQRLAEREKKEVESNILLIDSTFMPINRVNFIIEKIDEHKKKLTKDCIILEIWTNGSIHPKEAIHKAAQALIHLIAPLQEIGSFKPVFLNSSKVLQRSSSSSSYPEVGTEKTKKILKLVQRSGVRNPLNGTSFDIGILDLSLRPYTCLKRAKIETVADLLQYSSEDLLNLKNFGKHSLDEVEKLLNQMGLKLRSQKVDEVHGS